MGEIGEMEASGLAGVAGVFGERVDIVEDEPSESRVGDKPGVGADGLGRITICS